MKLLIATTNPGKIAEYQALFADLNLNVVGLRDQAIDFEVEETGTTFEENARLKARAYAEASGILTLADDSGLCVDALGGAPGVFSARYAEGDRARIERLLTELRDIPDDQRAARFVCVIALAEPGGETTTFEGTCEGRIAWQPRGTHGFGFDPVFLFPDHGQTMAELPMSIKNQISHRARATAKARRWLLAYLSRSQVCE
ncbi:MAG TPA: XTP/dITP diphosphatase [Anaerolineae bacterium]|nr:XTP/dITP diphosphatase [Anaerolineae bacterium]